MRSFHPFYDSTKDELRRGMSYSTEKTADFSCKDRAKDKMPRTQLGWINQKLATAISAWIDFRAPPPQISVQSSDGCIGGGLRREIGKKIEGSRDCLISRYSDHP